MRPRRLLLLPASALSFALACSLVVDTSGLSGDPIDAGNSADVMDLDVGDRNPT